MPENQVRAGARSNAADLPSDPETACDIEPIHLSGAVQPQGFLLGVDQANTVVACSQNVADLLHRNPSDLLGYSLEAAIGPEANTQAVNLCARPRPQDATPLLVTLPRRTSAVSAGDGSDTPGPPDTCELVGHRSGDLTLLEFEPTPALTDTAFVSLHQSLRQAMERVSGVAGIEELCAIGVEEVRLLTGFDRVMAYRFAPDGHGQVIAEDHRPDLSPLLGFHYPASDIPRQARALYLRNWVRLIADVSYTPSPIVSLDGALPAEGLDLSLAGLRSVSPAHLQYLKNMEVQASASISIIVDDELWGLIACHHENPIRVSQQVRLACQTIGQLLSLQISGAQNQQRSLRAAELARHVSIMVAAMAAGETPADGAATAVDSLLGVVGAIGAVLHLSGRQIQVGELPAPELVTKLVEVMSDSSYSGMTVASDDISRLLGTEPPAAGHHHDGDGDPKAAGALFTRLPDQDDGFILWIRAEQARTMSWAGNPHGKEVGPPTAGDPSAPTTSYQNTTGSLNPRTSFAEWKETVRGTSAPWLDADLDSAEQLALAIPELLLLQDSRHRLLQLALHDSLTGLPNRAMLLDRLAVALQGLHPIGGEGIAVLFVDLDGLKAVNDALGHHTGDQLLTLAARRLESLFRSQDLVARLGGDEFVVLIDGLIEPERARVLAERLVDEFRRPFDFGGGQSASATASVGMVVVTEPLGADEALRRADSAVYHAKRQGKNQVAQYDDETKRATTLAEHVGRELRHALATDEFELYFQPIFALADGEQRLISTEALLRWRHPVRGLLLPASFLAVAEETGLIMELGDWALAAALEQFAQWRRPDLTLSVNVAADQLLDDGFAARVHTLLQGVGLDPSRLCLEVTESQMMADPRRAGALLVELANDGVRIAIDDFGTGYASLAYIRNLPASLLKIDRTFVSGLPNEPRDRAIIASTVGLAHELGMRTVGEGVETAEQLSALHELGCDAAQGYYLGRPAPAEGFAAILTANPHPARR